MPRPKDYTLATSAASDDFLLIDGTTNGTRRLSASSPAVGDLILGTSGPSVKSTLSARAPRQGLVFDGTAGASVSGVPALGTSATVAFSINPKTRPTYSTVLYGNAGCLYIYYDAAGNLIVQKAGGTTVVTSGGGAVEVGKWQAFAITYDGTTARIYKNGVELFTNAISVDFTGTNTAIGWTGSYEIADGAISQFLIYNRALSASEVVALYEAGAPSGADYQTGGAGTKNTNVFVNSSFLPYTTLTGATTGLTAVIASGTAYAQSSPVFTVRVGSKVRVTGSISTAASTVYPSVSLTATDGTSLSSPTAITADGSFSIELTATVASSIATLSFFSTGNANYTVTSASVNLLGLLLAPDAAQAGGGLVWYDTSGNAANISWTSGVSWNVPTSGNLAGNLQVNGTGNNVFRGPIRWGNTSWPGYNGYISEASTDSALIPAIARNLIGSTGSNYTIANGQLGYYSGFELGTDIRWFAASGTFTTGQSLVPTERMRLTYGGNLLIGTPTDVGAKVYSKVADGVLSFGAAGTTKGIRFAHASTYSSIDGVDSSLSGSYQPLQINGSTVQIATNGGTVAASFDSSQNATFAGKAYINGSYTNGALGVRASTSGTNSIVQVATIEATSTGTPTDGFGGGIDFYNKNLSGGGPSIAGRIAAVFKNTTYSNYEGEVSFWTASNLSLYKQLTLSPGNDAAGISTFAGPIAIGNTVNTVSPTSPNRTITMVIGGTTYYIHAKTTND